MKAIPSFISSIANTHYFILMTKHEPNPPVDSQFSLKSYMVNCYFQSALSSNDRYLPHFGIVNRMRIILGMKIEDSVVVDIFEVQKK